MYTIHTKFTQLVEVQLQSNPIYDFSEPPYDSLEYPGPFIVALILSAIVSWLAMYLYSLIVNVGTSVVTGVVICSVGYFLHPSILSYITRARRWKPPREDKETELVQLFSLFGSFAQVTSKLHDVIQLSNILYAAATLHLDGSVYIWTWTKNTFAVDQHLVPLRAFMAHDERVTKLICGQYLVVLTSKKRILYVHIKFYYEGDGKDKCVFHSLSCVKELMEASGRAEDILMPVKSGLEILWRTNKQIFFVRYPDSRQQLLWCFPSESRGALIVCTAIVQKCVLVVMSDEPSHILRIYPFVLEAYPWIATVPVINITSDGINSLVVNLADNTVLVLEVTDRYRFKKRYVFNDNGGMQVRVTNNACVIIDDKAGTIEMWKKPWQPWWYYSWHPETVELVNNMYDEYKERTISKLDSAGKWLVYLPESSIWVPMGRIALYRGILLHDTLLRGVLHDTDIVFQ